MPIAQVKEQLDEYRDQYGLVQNSRGGSCGNGLCLTAESIVMLNRLHGLGDDDREKFRRAVAACEKEPGLLMRHPTDWQEQEGPDDIIGVAVASILLKTPEIPQRILDYGRSHKFKAWGPIKLPYYYRNETPYVDNDPRAWLGRQLGLIGLLKLGAGEGMPWYARKVLEFSVFHTGSTEARAHSPGGQDEWRLSDLVSEVLVDMGASSREAVRQFDRKYQEIWGHDCRSNMYLQYFGHEHWLTKYSLGISQAGVKL